MGILTFLVVLISQTMHQATSAPAAQIHLTALKCVVQDEQQCSLTFSIRNQSNKRLTFDATLRIRIARKLDSGPIYTGPIPDSTRLDLLIIRPQPTGKGHIISPAIAPAVIEPGASQSYRILIPRHLVEHSTLQQRLTGVVDGKIVLLARSETYTPVLTGAN